MSADVLDRRTARRWDRRGVLVGALVFSFAAWLWRRAAAAASPVNAPGHREVLMWTFARGGAELTIEQWVDRGAVVVTIRREDETGAEKVHVREFSDLAAAEHFHGTVEPALIEAGWSFIGYLPERRSHDDRRHEVQTTDRRRWWTDGALILD